MDYLFEKRMRLLTDNGSFGGKLVSDSNIIEDKLFENDRNFHRGILYDWNMDPLDTVDFKLEKIKTYTTGGTEVEYVIRFRPNYNPEEKFKYLHRKQDGRERFGFYIDVTDNSKNIIEKWLITGKDDRVAFDRYSVLRCNWCFEWVLDNKYYNCVGCVRDINRSASDNNDSLGGTSVDGDMAILMPSNDKVVAISLGTRFMITDSPFRPQVFEVVKVVDFSPLGITTLYLKQCLYNAHTDFCGDINLQDDYKFCFDLPIEDLPEAYGGQYHMLCDCVVDKGNQDIPNGCNSVELKCEERYLYVNGASVEVEAVSKNPRVKYTWRIYVDGVEYQIKDLSDYFDITCNDNLFTIKAISKVMAKYVVRIAIYNTNQRCIDSVDLEVCI